MRAIQLDGNIPTHVHGQIEQTFVLMHRGHRALELTHAPTGGTFVNKQNVVWPDMLVYGEATIRCGTCGVNIWYLLQQAAVDNGCLCSPLGAYNG